MCVAGSDRALVPAQGGRRGGKRGEADDDEGELAVVAKEEPLKHVNFFEDLELQQRAEDTVTTLHDTRTALCMHCHRCD
jgi:hypothetical protein